MDICKNCKTVLIGELHRNAYVKCNNPQPLNLVGVKFMDGYFMFQVVAKYEDGYRCNSTNSGIRGRIYTHDHIVNNFIK